MLLSNLVWKKFNRELTDSHLIFILLISLWIDTTSFTTFFHLTLLYTGTWRGFCCCLDSKMSISKLYHDLRFLELSLSSKCDGWFVITRSRTLVPLVGSSTIFVRPLSSSMSVNLWWILDYCVFNFSVFFFQSHPGKLKSPATSIKLFFILDVLPRLLSNWFSLYSLAV